MCALEYLKTLKTLGMYNIELIKFKLRTKGSSLSKISRSLGVTPSAVTQALQGKQKSQRIVDAVTEKYKDLYGNDETLPMLLQAFAV
jgi:predicted transcriptional regulator